jgi:hypothetical protein
MAGFPPPKRWRTIRRDSLFEQLAAQIQPDARRLDDQLLGVEQIISRNAERCPRMPGTILHLIKTDPFPGAPRLRIYFTIDDENHCTLRHIEKRLADQAD